MAENRKEPAEDHVLLTHDPLSCEVAVGMVQSDSAGATSMFIGKCCRFEGDHECHTYIEIFKGGGLS